MSLCKRDDGNRTGSLSHLLSSISIFIDENKRPISYGFYLLAGVGLLKIMHSIQAFRQFRSVRDIPEEFVAKRMNIFATVREARLVAGTSGSLTPVLSVEHVPLAKVPWSATSHSDLQIALAAVAVPSETILRSQAENVLSAKSGGRKVKIQLLEVSDELVYGRVRLKSLGFWRDCLALRLVRDGLATVGPYPGLPDQTALAYMAQLEKAERAAKKQGKGVWQLEEKDRQESLWRRFIFWPFKKFTK